MSIFSSMFSHGGIFHLLGNLLFLYLYGDNVEDSMGKLNYFFFFLACGVCAAFAQALMDPSSKIPMVGASRAISGVIASYLLLFPRANVRVFYWLIILVGTIHLPKILTLGSVANRANASLTRIHATGRWCGNCGSLGRFCRRYPADPSYEKKQSQTFPESK